MISLLLNKGITLYTPEDEFNRSLGLKKIGRPLLSGVSWGFANKIAVQFRNKANNRNLFHQ